MMRDFLYGIIQGALLAILAGSLLPGLFGSMFLAFDFLLNGATAFSGIIIYLVANLVFYWFFSKKAMEQNAMIFYCGLLVGFVIVFFMG